MTIIEFRNESTIEMVKFLVLLKIIFLHFNHGYIIRILRVKKLME